MKKRDTTSPVAVFAVIVVLASLFAVRDAWATCPSSLSASSASAGHIFVTGHTTWCDPAPFYNVSYQMRFYRSDGVEVDDHGWPTTGSGTPPTFTKPGGTYYYDVIADLNVSCWPPGTYTAKFNSGCSEQIGSTCYVAGTPMLQTTFVVPPTEVTIAAARSGNDFRINYNYGPDGTSGTMTYSVDGGSDVSVADPDCHHAVGTCLVNIPLGCGGGLQSQHTVTFSLGSHVGCPAPHDTQVVRIECGDDTSCNRSCPMCVGAPVNVGSGNVKVSVPLFSMNEPGRPLTFDLQYDSVRHPNENLIRRPLGAGWTHRFNAQIAPINGTRLQYFTPEGETQFFDGTMGGISWTPGRPATSTDTIVLSGADYVLRTLSGDATHFDAATGRWTSTTDRYGNTFSGAYDGAGNLSTITDPLGRTLTLAYTGSVLNSATAWDGTTRWLFGSSGGELTGVSDPIHGSSSWRTFTYTADHNTPAVQRLLTGVYDDVGALLEGHAYDSLDRGISSTSEGGRSSFTIEYEQPVKGQVRVTETRAGVTQITVYSIDFIGGIFYPASIAGVCSSCGSTTDSQSFTYDAAGRVLSRTDGEGHTTAHTYDGNGNVATRTDAAGTARARTITYQHSYAMDPAFVTQTAVPSVTGTGTKTTDRSYGTGETLLTSSVTGRLPSAPSSPVTYTSTVSFDTRHRMTQQHGPRTDVSTVSTLAYYDDLDADLNRRGRLRSTTDAAGLTTIYDNYDLYGTARRVTDPNGVVTLLATDASGRVTSRTNKAVSGDASEATDFSQTFNYDSRDRLTQSVNARNFATQYNYESGTNRLLDTIRLDAGGDQRERRHLTLDPSGHVTKEEDQVCGTPSASCSSWTSSRTVSQVYDQKGRRVETDYPIPVSSPARVLYSFDLDGKLSAVQDENHTSPNTSYLYDELERLTRVTQLLGGAPGGSIQTSYAYDVQDNLTSVVDPNGNVTTYAYDDFGRMQSQTSPVTGTTSYAYDPAANLTSTTDANAATTARTYDAANRVLTAVSSRPGAPTETVTWTYDDTMAGNYGRGRLATMADPAGTTQYRYERRGSLRAEIRSGAGAYTTAYSYDANGNRATMTTPSGARYTYSFDYADRPVSALWGTSAAITSASYLPFGPQTTMAYVNGLLQTQQYDQRYRLTENKLTMGAATIADYLYAYDPAGNITQIHDGVDASYNRDFAYDDLNRLTAANTGTSLWGTGTYQYDAMGNMTAQSISRLVVPEDGGTTVPAVLDTTSFGYVANAASGNVPKLATVTEDGLDHTVSYDAAGNETAYLMPRAYSARNLLTSVQDVWETTQTHRIDYSYDGRGVRVAAAEQPASAAGGTATRYCVYTPELQLLSVSQYDMPNVWGNARRVSRNDFATPRYEMFWFAGKPVGQVDAGGYGRFTFTDHLGTPILQTDYAGSVIWQADYEPFGNVWQMRAGVRTDQPLRFPGQEVAMSWEGSEENYNIFRWYRSGWGRYTQADPLHYRPANWSLGDGSFPIWDPQAEHAGENSYSYALENPERLVDPLGLSGRQAQCVAMYGIAGTIGGSVLGGGGLAMASAGVLALPGAAYGAVIGGLAGTAIGMIVCTDVETCPIEFSRTRQWKCEAKCSVMTVPGGYGTGTYVTGSASGSNQNDTCRAAKRVASEGMGQGLRVKHCDCRCSQ